jgi:hypothetical protein
MHKKQTTTDVVNSRRMSLANLVNAHIELKRYSETPTNNGRVNGSISNHTTSGSQSTLFDTNKLFGKRISNGSTFKNDYMTPVNINTIEANSFNTKNNPFAFLTSTTTLAQNNLQQMVRRMIHF